MRGKQSVFLLFVIFLMTLVGCGPNSLQETIEKIGTGEYPLFDFSINDSHDSITTDFSVKTVMINGAKIEWSVVGESTDYLVVNAIGEVKVTIPKNENKWVTIAYKIVSEGETSPSFSVRLQLIGSVVLVSELKMSNDIYELTVEKNTRILLPELTVVPNDAQNKEYGWSISEDLGNVLSFDGDYLVAGDISQDRDAKILATASDSGGVTREFIVYIVANAINPDSITVSGSSQVLLNTSYSFTVEILPTNATITKVIWSLSPSSSGSINEDGIATFTETGSVSVTATSVSTAVNIFGSLYVTVSENILVARLRALPEVDHLEVNTAKEIVVKAYPPTAVNKAVTWAVSPADMGTITPGGDANMPGAGWTASFTASNNPGRATITATATDGSGIVATSRINIVSTIVNRGSGNDDKVYAKLVDLDDVTRLQRIVARKPGEYMGHTSIITLDENDSTQQAMVYPSGHGAGAINLVTSDNDGLTWTVNRNTPASWVSSKECPIVYTLKFIDGTIRYLQTSGLPRSPMAKGFMWSLSSDGLNWTEHELASTGTWSTVPLSDLVQLKDPNTGEFIDKWMGIYHSAAGTNHLVYLTFNGGKEAANVVFVREELFPDSGDNTVTGTANNAGVEGNNLLCEVAFIRSPDHESIAFIARNQAHNDKGSFISFSYDEGETWSNLVQTPVELDGERHQGKYFNDGRLIIAFREMLLRQTTDWFCGELSAWIGTYLDLLKGGSGQYLVCLKRDYTPNFRSGDTGYPTLVTSDDGSSIRLTSYGTFDAPGNLADMESKFGNTVGFGSVDWTSSSANTGSTGRDWSPYIMSINISVSGSDSIDELAKTKTVSFDESWRKFPKSPNHISDLPSERCTGDDSCTYHLQTIPHRITTTNE